MCLVFGIHPMVFETETQSLLKRKVVKLKTKTFKIVFDKLLNTITYFSLADRK